MPAEAIWPGFLPINSLCSQTFSELLAVFYLFWIAYLQMKHNGTVVQISPLSMDTNRGRQHVRCGFLNGVLIPHCSVLKKLFNLIGLVTMRSGILKETL